MKVTKDTVKRFFKQTLAFVPTLLPIGVEAFDVWAKDVLYIYNFPDNDSTRWALATMIMHLGPTSAYKTKRFFGLSIHTAAAKQVAHNIFYELKQKQQADQKAEQDKQAAVTGTTAGSANVIPI